MKTIVSDRPKAPVPKFCGKSVHFSLRIPTSDWETLSEHGSAEINWRQLAQLGLQAFAAELREGKVKIEK